MPISKSAPEWIIGKFTSDLCFVSTLFTVMVVTVHAFFVSAFFSQKSRFTGVSSSCAPHMRFFEKCCECAQMYLPHRRDQRAKRRSSRVYGASYACRFQGLMLTGIVHLAYLPRVNSTLTICRMRGAAQASTAADTVHLCLGTSTIWLLRLLHDDPVVCLFLLRRAWHLSNGRASTDNIT